METLGWIIWAFGCAALIDRLIRLRKPRKRLFGAISCIITATGLAVTYFTPFSKFHLLWILPLPILLGPLLFVLFAVGVMTYHKITARKPKKTTLPAGSYQPFDVLEWDDNESWEGKVSLPAWAGFQSRGGGYASQDSDEPSDGSVRVSVDPPGKDAPLEPTPEQCRALEYQIQNGDEVVQSVLTALLPYYHDLKSDWEANDKDMPPISDTADFRKMIGLGTVHILPVVSDGLAYIGMEFGCDWDEEHGLGVVVHGKNVVEIGQAMEVCDWQPTPVADE